MSARHVLLLLFQSKTLISVLIEVFLILLWVIPGLPMGVCWCCVVVDDGGATTAYCDVATVVVVDIS